MKACPYCQRQNAPERKFCADCGADLQGGVDQSGVRHTPVPPGTVFEGKYEILSELGRGGMGVVYRGKDLSLERQVAIKVLPERFNTESEVIERFRREARAMASLDHPNIIPVYAIGQQDNFHYFAMKYLDGETLAQTLERLRPRKEGFDPKIVRDVVIQVCKGLDHAHRQGLIHRDIKPGNIMVSESGQVTIMDFGIVKKDQDGDGAENNLTKTGLVFGTPEYMAPEQAQGLAPPGPTTDLYAVGIVAYEMLTGRPPFEGGSPFSIVFKHIKNPPDPLVDRIPGMPARFQELVFKSLAKDPAQRYQTAREMFEAFEAFSFDAPIVQQPLGVPLEDKPSHYPAPTPRHAPPHAPSHTPSHAPSPHIQPHVSPAPSIDPLSNFDLNAQSLSGAPLNPQGRPSANPGFHAEPPPSRMSPPPSRVPSQPPSQPPPSRVQPPHKRHSSPGQMSPGRHSSPGQMSPGRVNGAGHSGPGRRPTQQPAAARPNNRPSASKGAPQSAQSPYGSARKPMPPKKAVRNNNMALLGAIGFVGFLGIVLILFALLHTPSEADGHGDVGVEDLIDE